MSPLTRETDSVTIVPLIGEKFAKLLKNLGIKTIGDLLRHYPSRYVDFSTTRMIDTLQPGETVTISGTVSSFIFRPTRKRGFTIQEAVLVDPTGSIKLLWFNQPYLRNIVAKEIQLSVAGVVEQENGKLSLKNPEYEVLKEVLKGSALSGVLQGRALFNKILIHTGRIVPIYPETKGISSKWLRSKIALITGTLDWYEQKYNVIPKIPEWLTDILLEEETLISLKEALVHIHFPSSFEALDKARKRLGFDELFAQQLVRQYKKLTWQQSGKAKKILCDNKEIHEFIYALPFQLTDDQNEAIKTILHDLSLSIPMNRLLQGDVGSGKTIVAAIASLATIRAGFQVALMVPTQVLADQHAETLRTLLAPYDVHVSLLTGSLTNSKLKTQNSKPFPDLIIGTHALIHDRAKLLIDKDRLALVIIDEQHRFGVEQRAKLIERGTFPHVLSMTATPIPRTISLTLYGNLDITYIRQMPQGRIPVKTWVVPEEKRIGAYHWLERQMRPGNQVFVVCPLIEGSEHESLRDIKAAIKEFDKLQQVFPKFHLALLHGKVPGNKKSLILSEMREGKLDMLVTTPVIEVGVDIPKATVMVIEGADRFGLAQLHQLRGRVGRREEQSYCLLFPTAQASSSRLKALETIHQGLELAELDLRWRGPGQIFGSQQHGWPQFKIADIADIEQVRRVNAVATRYSAELEKYPKMKKRVVLLDNSIAPN